MDEQTYQQLIMDDNINLELFVEIINAIGLVVRPETYAKLSPKAKSQFKPYIAPEEPSDES